MKRGWKAWHLSGWIGTMVIAGMLLASCSPRGGELVGQTASAATGLPVTGVTAAPATLTPGPTTTTAPTQTQTASPRPTETLAPTLTASPVPDTAVPPTATPDNGRFSLTSANGVAPEDIIREMTVAVEGKGDGPCFDKNDQVFLNSNDRFLMEAVYASICGWDPSEDITFTVTDPNGRVRSVTEKPEKRDEQVMFRARYQPRLDDPVGNYHFVVESSSAHLEYDVTYHTPAGAHLYILSENRFRPLINTDLGQYRLRFQGFQPGESVRLFAYQANGRDSNDNETRELVGWRDYSMNDNGNLEIDSDARNLAFLAYGQQSGEVHLFTLKRGGGDLWDWFGSQDYYCPGAPLPRLNLNDQAAPTVDLDGLDVPGASGNVTFTLAAGTQVFLQSGPKCADGAFWWQVFDPNGNPGWAPETRDGEYVLKKE